MSATTRHDPALEQISAGIVVSVIVMSIAGSMHLYWARLVAWGLEQRLLVPASSAPLVPLPSAAGAGLDAARVAVVVGVTVVAVAIGVSALSYWVRRRPRAVQ